MSQLGLSFVVGYLSCLLRVELTLVEMTKYFKLMFPYIPKFEVSLFCFHHKPVL